MRIWSIGSDSGVVPVLLGEGIPLFPSGFPQRNFTLLRK